MTALLIDSHQKSMLPFAVHITDGFLAESWLLGGFLLMALGLVVGCARLSDRDIPRIGVFTAAFFVASQVHLPLGGISVHLILNGLLGVVLRHRAMPAIAVGLFLQSFLFHHGGRWVLGVNWCVMAIPAVLAGYLFPLLRRSRLSHNRTGRTIGVLVVALVWLGFALTAAQILLARAHGEPFDFRDPPPLWLLEPLVFLGLMIPAIGLAFLERRLEADPDFALGLFVGLFAAGGTVLLNAVVMWLGGKNDLHSLAALAVILHVPIIALEGLGVGFAVAVLAKAKPEWLGQTSA